MDPLRTFFHMLQFVLQHSTINLYYWINLSFCCDLTSGASNGSVPQNICSSGTFLLAGRCGRNNSPWKEIVAGKKIIQGFRGDLKSRIAARSPARLLVWVTYHSRSKLCPMKLPSKSGCRL